MDDSQYLRKGLGLPRVIPEHFWYAPQLKEKN